MSENSEGFSDILRTVAEVNSNLLPLKSREKYEKSYQQFCSWRESKKVEGSDENILLAYFFEKAKTLKSSTLWSFYSMLKSTLAINENVDISTYKTLLAYLKRQNDVYVAKKSKVFTMDNVNTFLTKAPDDTYLFMKIVPIFALYGACRADELRLLNLEDVEDTGSVLVVTLHDTKTKKKRVFVINSEMKNVNGIELYRKYLSLRPRKTDHRRLFVFYRNNKCTVQPVGINTFYSIPKKIAEYLGLPDAKSYTGHCFRRTSVTFLADSGADIQILKRHGGWRSDAVAEGYVEDSLENKLKTSRRIFTSETAHECTTSREILDNQQNVNEQPVSAAVSCVVQSTVQTSEKICTEVSDFKSIVASAGMTFNNLNNCTFCISVNKSNE